MAAVTYFIAGKANCPLFAKAQQIGEIVSKSLPSVAVRVQSQHPAAWPDYLKALCTRLNITHQTSPIVYTQLGNLVGDCEAFHSMVKKMYGDFITIPSAATLNDMAAENFEKSSQEIHKNEMIAQNQANEVQWELRNQRLKVITEQIAPLIRSRSDSVSRLFHSLQLVTATLSVAQQRHKLPEEARYFRDQLATITNSFPALESVKREIEKLIAQAESLNFVPSLVVSPNGSHYTRNPDAMWSHMFEDHQNIMKEFEVILERIHEANTVLQAEANKLAEEASKIQSASRVSPSSTSTSTSSSEPHHSSHSPIPIDRFQKSVSFAGTDTQYTPKGSTTYHSLPSTPKKVETDESDTLPTAEEVAVDSAPVMDTMKAMMHVVEEGLNILKRAGKQLRIDSHSTTKQITMLKKVLDVDEYRPFRLRERREIGKNIHSFRFDLPSSSDTLGCSIGKHIFVKIGDIERAYTPITTDFDNGYFDIAVKVTRDTPMMEYFSSMTPGHWVPIKGPSGINAFKDEDKISGIAMFAHGVGLTPMVQIIRHYLAQDSDTTPLWLLYFNSEEKMFLKEELERLSVAHTRFNLRYMTTKPGNHWEHLQTRDLSPSLPFRPSGFDISSEPNPMRIFICGTTNFTQKTKHLLGQIGYTEEHIHTF